MSETNKLIWKTKEEIQEEFEYSVNNWKPNQSKDGFVISAEGKFIYRNIAYLIRVLKYYTHQEGFKPIGDRLTDSHVVVEYPDESKELVDIIQKVWCSEFLYHDTLHTWNNKQTLEEQIESCHKMAKNDIDSLYDGEIKEIIINNIKELNKILDKVIK